MKLAFLIHYVNYIETQLLFSSKPSSTLEVWNNIFLSFLYTAYFCRTYITCSEIFNFFIFIC